MKSRKTTGKKKKKQSKAKRLVTTVFIVSAVLFLGCRFILKSYNTSLSIDNQKLSAEIDSMNESIEVLKSEITQLEEKNRVLGVLEGQVFDNQDNVVYYNED